jgi:hypothetical protein
MRNNDLTAAINVTVETFVRDITALAGKAAIQLVENTFGTPSKSVDVTVATRDKRSSKDLDTLCDRFAGFVAKEPGLRIEQINKKLGTQTKDLALPIRKMISSGRVKTKGQKRSTTYWPGKAK